MNFLVGWKLYAIGGVAIISLLLLANHLENNGIREDVASEWRTAIQEAKPTIIRDTTYIEIPKIIGTGKSDRVYIASTVPDEIIDSMDYYRWVTQPYSYFVDTAGVELNMTAKPLESTIEYSLKLPPKEIQTIEVTKLVLSPPIERNWIVGFDFGYHGEGRTGILFGLKPVIVGIDYYPHIKEYGGHVQFQWEF